MARYRANPVLVDALPIIAATPIPSSGGFHLELEGGIQTTATREMTVRHIPSEGDYFVVQDDGYEYVNPKAVFERKYSLVTEEKQAAPSASDSKVVEMPAPNAPVAAPPAEVKPEAQAPAVAPLNPTPEQTAE